MFRREFIEKTKKIYEGHYSLKPLVVFLDDSYVKLEKEKDHLNEMYSDDIESKKSNLQKLINKLLCEELLVSSLNCPYPHNPDQT